MSTKAVQSHSKKACVCLCIGEQRADRWRRSRTLGRSHKASLCNPPEQGECWGWQWVGLCTAGRPLRQADQSKLQRGLPAQLCRPSVGPGARRQCVQVAGKDAHVMHSPQAHLLCSEQSLDCFKTANACAGCIMAFLFACTAQQAGAPGSQEACLTSAK